MQYNYLTTKKPFKGNLFYGMQGERIKELQVMLDTLNDYYNFRKGKSLPTTGFYGDETKRFVTMFQLFVEVYPADGMVDARTHDMLEARYYNYITSSAAAMRRG